MKKSGERRGNHLTIATKVPAFFRKIFAAQIPPSAQRDQGRNYIFKGQRSNATKAEQTSSRQPRYTVS